MLSDNLKVLLASVNSLSIKAQNFHWNVEGPDFGQLHKFFAKIYEDAYSAIDPIAEFIRYLDEYAPGSFERFGELTKISGQTKIPRPHLMFAELLSDNEKMIDLLNACFSSAEEENKQGIANFIAERLDLSLIHI